MTSELEQKYSALMKKQYVKTRALHACRCCSCPIPAGTYTRVLPTFKEYGDALYGTNEYVCEDCVKKANEIITHRNIQDGQLDEKKILSDLADPKIFREAVKEIFKENTNALVRDFENSLKKQ